MCLIKLKLLLLASSFLEGNLHTRERERKKKEIKEIVRERQKRERGRERTQRRVQKIKNIIYFVMS